VGTSSDPGLKAFITGWQMDSGTTGRAYLTHVPDSMLQAMIYAVEAGIAFPLEIAHLGEVEITSLEARYPNNSQSETIVEFRTTQ
jgi:hypothetical protein